MNSNFKNEEFEQENQMQNRAFSEFEAKQEVVAVAIETSLELTQQNEIKDGLKSILSEREILIDAYNDVIRLEITSENLETFKELRLKIVKNRTQGIEKWHKVNKEYFLNGGRFVDSIKNKEIAENQRMESNLLSNEKHFENIEKERLEKLQEDRMILVSPFLESIENVVLNTMEEDVFLAYLSTKKQQYQMKLEIESKIEAERLAKIEAERLENERIRLENEALKETARLEKTKSDEVLRLAKIESDKLLAEQLEKSRLEQIESDKIENEKRRLAKIESDKLLKIATEKATEKRIADDLENSRLAKIEAERLAKIEEAKKPIQEKLKQWVSSFELPTQSINNETSKQIQDKFESFKSWAEKQINN